MVNNQKIFLGLISSVSTLAVICAILLTWNILRPTRVVEKIIEVEKILEVEKIVKVETDENRVVFEFGDGSRVSAPADGVLEFEGDLNKILEPFKSKSAGTASGHGVGIKSSGDDIDLDLDFGAPNASLPDGGASSSGSANLAVKAIIKNGGTSAYIAGAVFMLIGFLAWFWLGRRKIGGAFIATGISIIVLPLTFQQYPWTLLIVLFGFLAIVGVAIYDFYNDKNKNKTFSAIIAAGENLPEKVKSIYKKHVRGEMQARGIESTGRKTVEVAKKNGGGSPRAKVDTTIEELELADDIQRRRGGTTTSGNGQPNVIVVPQQNGAQPIVYVNDSVQ